MIEYFFGIRVNCGNAVDVPNSVWHFSAILTITKILYLTTEQNRTSFSNTTEAKYGDLHLFHFLLKNIAHFNPTN